MYLLVKRRVNPWILATFYRVLDASLFRVGTEPYSGTLSPDPPNSFGKSFSFGNPSFIRSTVSA